MYKTFKLLVYVMFSSLILFSLFSFMARPFCHINIVLFNASCPKPFNIFNNVNIWRLTALLGWHRLLYSTYDGLTHAAATPKNHPYHDRAQTKKFVVAYHRQCGMWLWIYPSDAPPTFHPAFRLLGCVSEASLTHILHIYIRGAHYTCWGLRWGQLGWSLWFNALQLLLLLLDARIYAMTATGAAAYVNGNGVSGWCFSTAAKNQCLGDMAYSAFAASS